MDTEQLKTQQLQLLAKKSLLHDELKSIDTALGQIGAILQFASQPAAAPTASPAG